jgi:serine protease Do
MNNEQQEHPEASRQTVRVVKRSNKKIIIIACIVLAAIGAGVWYGGSQLYTYINSARQSETVGHQGVSNDGNKIITKEEGDIANVVDKVGPSVVSIVTKATGTSFYGATEEEGAGTGIIVGKDGYILTNKHVITGVNAVRVVLSDGTQYENVKVLGADPLNDVAFLKVENVSNLPAVELGDSSSIRVGQRVVAIGNSLGQYQNTVTSGIISGIGRPIAAQAGETVENLSDLLQTDAAINPGNSGGPLLNLNGQVIGINTAIIENAQGIGFSIPINATKGILKGVLGKGIVERAYLGVNFIPVTPDVAKSYNLPVKKGAYIQGLNGKTAVIKDGPADKAGIKDGDIIMKIGGVEVGTGGGISSLISEYAPSDTIEAVLLRGGQTLTMKITLAAYKA